MPAVESRGAHSGAHCGAHCGRRGSPPEATRAVVWKLSPGRTQNAISPDIPKRTASLEWGSREGNILKSLTLQLNGRERPGDKSEAQPYTTNSPLAGAYLKSRPLRGLAARAGQVFVTVDPLAFKPFAPKPIPLSGASISSPFDGARLLRIISAFQPAPWAKSGKLLGRLGADSGHHSGHPGF